MTMMSPLTVEGKGLDLPTHWAELTGFVAAAARDGLPAHEMERGLWQALLRLVGLRRIIRPDRRWRLRRDAALADGGW